MSAPAGRRQRAERRGRWAETAAALWLVLHGWRIVARRRRVADIEIDIVAARRDMIAIIEVKYRRTHDLGLIAVDPLRARRMQRAAHQVAAEHAARGRPVSARVDMIAIAPWRLPAHVRGIML